MRTRNLSHKATFQMRVDYLQVLQSRRLLLIGSGLGPEKAKSARHKRQRRRSKVIPRLGQDDTDADECDEKAHVRSLRKCLPSKISSTEKRLHSTNVEIENFARSASFSGRLGTALRLQCIARLPVWLQNSTRTSEAAAHHSRRCERQARCGSPGVFYRMALRLSERDT